MGRRRITAPQKSRSDYAKAQAIKRGNASAAAAAAASSLASAASSSPSPPAAAAATAPAASKPNPKPKRGNPTAKETIRGLERSRDYFKRQFNELKADMKAAIEREVEKRVNEALLSQNEQHKKEITNLEEALKKERIAKRENQKELAENRERLEKVVKDLKKKVNQHQTTAEKLEKQLERTKKKYDSEIDKYNKTIESLDTELKSTKEEVTNIKLTLKTSTAEKRKTYQAQIQNAVDKERSKRMKTDENLNIATNETNKALREKTTAERKAQVAENRVEEAQQRTDETIRRMEAEHSSEVNDLDATIKELHEQVAKKSRVIEELKKSANNNKRTLERVKSGNVRVWDQRVLQLTLELLVQGVPSGSINAALVSFNNFLDDDKKLDIKELPSIWYIRRCRSILLTVSEVLAAYQLGNAEWWGQLHTDMTTRRQIPFLNLLLSYLPNGDEKNLLKTVLMSCSLHPYDETAEAQVECIIDHLDRMGKLLDRWREVHEEMFPGDKHDIPDALSLSLRKLAKDGAVTTDTCNSAKKTNALLIEAINARAEAEAEAEAEAGTSDVNVQQTTNEDVGNAVSDAVEGAVDNTIESENDAVDEEKRRVVLTIFCHHHIRNIWQKAVINRLSSFLSEKLRGDLSEIDSKYRVEPNMNSICRAVYKCFSLNCNYAKGSTKEIKQWYQGTLELQRKTKKEKLETQKKLGIEKAKKKHIECLHYFDRLQSDRCIRNAEALDKCLQNLSSNTKRLEECKEQIRIWHLGFGDNKFRHPWSKNSVAYSWDHLATFLKEEVYPKTEKINLSELPEPCPKMPFERPLPQLGRNTADVRKIYEKKGEETEEFISEAKKAKDLKHHPKNLVGKLEDIDDLLDRRIGVKFEYKNDDGSKENVWCNGEVVAVKRKNTFHVRWDAEWVEEDCPEVTSVTLDKKLFNKDVKGGWRVFVEDVVETEHHCVDSNIFSEGVEDGSRQN